MVSLSLENLANTLRNVNTPQHATIATRTITKVSKWRGKIPSHCKLEGIACPGEVFKTSKIRCLLNGDQADSIHDAIRERSEATGKQWNIDGAAWQTNETGTPLAVNEKTGQIYLRVFPVGESTVEYSDASGNPIAREEIERFIYPEGKRGEAPLCYVVKLENVQSIEIE